MEHPDELMIMVLDNGAFHKAKKLQIPDNIALVFLPPYAPELNPAEKVWWVWKRNFSNKLFPTIDSISNFIETQTKQMTNKVVKKLCAFDYIFSDSLWTII